MGGEYSNESRNVFYKRLRSSNYWHLFHYLTPKKSMFKQSLNYFVLEMAAIIVARRRHRRELRARGRRERIFSTRIHLFWMPEEHISFAYHIVCQAMLILKNLNSLASGSFQHTVASLFLYSLFATLICAALGILHWLICKFFNLRIESKSPSEISHRRCFGIVLSRYFALFSKTGP